MEEKTLIILTGSARGGEDTWNTMYENLQKPFNADIAVCFGSKENKSISLYEKAKYIWEIEEYDNWRDYYNLNFSGNWSKIFELNKSQGLMGGIDDNIGSGAIIFAFRHFILKNYENILKQYDRIILTRTDYFYIDKHPILPNDSFYIVEGEDYGGITDRHHIFNSKDLYKVMDVCNFICNEDYHHMILKYSNINPEILLKLYFEYNGIYNQIKRFKRVQFTVALNNDTTRWMKANTPLPGYPDLKIKYYSEYETAINNRKNK